MLGDAKYKTAMQNAFTLLTTQQQFATGGWGPNETFITPHKGELYDSLSTTVDHFETPCGSYAATKLARYLIRFTQPAPTPPYGDNLERVLYNTILAVKPPDSDGDYFYYSTYSPVADQGLLPQEVALLLRHARPNGGRLPAQYLLPIRRSEQPLRQPLHPVAGCASRQPARPFRSTQQTDYPAKDTITLNLHPAHAAPLHRSPAHPRLAHSAAAIITINGKSARRHGRARQPSPHSPAPGTPATASTSTLPQAFRTEPIDDQHPETVALMRGPVSTWPSTQPTISAKIASLCPPV